MQILIGIIDMNQAGQPFIHEKRFKSSVEVNVIKNAFS